MSDLLTRARLMRIVQGKPIVGWSEYLEERNIGVSQVIQWMGLLVTGLNP
jgi:hypothetical protein